MTRSRVISNGHSNNRATVREETDTFGAEIPTANPYPFQDYVGYRFGEQMYIEGGDPFDYSTGREIDGIPVSKAEFQRRVGNDSVDAGVFKGGKYVGSIKLSGRANATHGIFIYDLYRSGQKTPTPDFWYYLGTFATEYELPGAQNRPDQKSGAQQVPGRTPLTTDDVNSLLVDLKRLISNNECANFIESLLEQLKADTGRQQHGTTDILQLFEAVRTGRGFEWGPDLKVQATGGGGPKYASITINPTMAFKNLSNNSPGWSTSRARTLIHELFHVAGYGHDLMALAAYNMGERFDSKWRPWHGDFPNPDEDFFKPKDPDEAAARLDGAYSGFFGNILDQHCK